MKHLFFFFLIPLAGVVQAQDYSELAWSDEFDVNGAPSSANWGYDLGGGGWGNNELQTYTNSTNNVRVENGLLVIQAIKSGGSWTSGRVKSQGKQNFTYGKIVYRAKLPAGSGTWPALWMLGSSISNGVDWPACGEIDVMEHVGKQAGVVHGTLHSPSSFGNSTNTGTTNVPTFSTGFHEYAVLWTPEKIQFMVDDVPFYTYNPSNKNAQTWPFNASFFLIMNIAMGGNFGSDPQYETNNQRNGVDPSLSAVRMEVDYVRVYQEFKAPSLQGPSLVSQNQTGLVFKANQLSDATYDWTLPAGAQITAGAGTSNITVNWGNTEGDVHVKITHKGQAYTASLPVTQVVKPQTDTFSLTNLGIAWNTPGGQNVYTVSNDADAMRVDYKVAQPAGTPSLTGTLYRAADLSAHGVLRIRTRSFNKSRTLNMRVDLVDNEGKATNKSPVFNLTPLVTDGEYFDYAFDFENTNRWQSANGMVNKSRITTLNLYIDFGAFGAAGSDSLWIEDIQVANAIPVETLPVRPSMLTGKLANGALTLSWTDNAATETGFEIWAASIGTDAFTLLTTTPANATTSAVSVSGDPKTYAFKVRAVNAAGNSPYSNTYSPNDVITGIEHELASALKVYPNPAQNEVRIELPSYPATLRLYNTRQQVLVATTLAGPVTLPLSTYTQGLYYLVLQHRNVTLTRKLIIH